MAYLFLKIVKIVLTPIYSIFLLCSILMISNHNMHLVHALRSDMQICSLYRVGMLDS